MSPKVKETPSADAPLSPLELRLGMSSKIATILFVASTVLIALTLTFVYHDPDFNWSAYLKVNGFTAMNASGISAIYVAFLLCRPGSSQIQLSVLLGLISEVFYQFLVFPTEANFAVRAMASGGGFGVVGIVGILILYFNAKETNARERVKIYLLASVCIFIFPIALGKILGLMSLFTPLVYDSHAYIFEGSFGFQPAQEVCRLLGRSQLLYYLTLAIYSRLPLFVFIALWFTLRFESRCKLNILDAFFFGGTGAFVFYIILPMVGIDIFIGSPPWPIQELPVLTEFSAVSAPRSFPRTCFPSMHTAWILIPVFALSHLSRKFLVGTTAIAVLTILASLGPSIGHYLVDIVVGFPYSLALAAASTSTTPANKKLKSMCIAYGLGFTLLLAVGLRLAPALMVANSGICWVLMIAVAVSVIPLHSRLVKLTLQS